jgi:hypothetical protein
MCCEIEGPSHDFMTSALATAAQKHDIDMIQLLLEVGAKPYVPLTLNVLIPGPLDATTKFELLTGTNAMNELRELSRAARHGTHDVPDCERLMQATKLLTHAKENSTMSTRRKREDHL